MIVTLSVFFIANVADIFSTLLLRLLSAAQLVFRAMDFVLPRNFFVAFRSERLVGSGGEWPEPHR